MSRLLRRGRRPANHPGMNPFLAGVIALVLILLGVYFGFTKSNPFADPYTFEAAFASANDIKAKSLVRIAGVNVGKVTKVRAADPDTGKGAIVTMEIDEKGLPLHKDMTLKIRPRIFLEGNWFVDLKPGSPSAPIAEDGYVVPVQQTSTPVQIGQVLSALQDDTRTDLRVVLDEYGRALADKTGTKLEGGGAEGYNRSVRWWLGAFRDSAIVNRATLGERPHDLSEYLDGADKFARGIDRNTERLQTLLTSLAVTADALASEDVNLRAAIHELPTTLQVSQRALGRLNEAFPSLRRFVRDLRPTVRESGPAIDAQLPLIEQMRRLVQESELKGLVRDMRAVVPDLTELNVEGVPLQEQLRMLSNCGNEVLVPWRNDKIEDAAFPASGNVYQEQVKWLPGIAAESRNFDANGQYVRSLANGANIAYELIPGQFAVTGQPLQGVNPPPADKPPPLRADVPCETQQPPDLRTIPAAAPTGIKVNHNAPGAAERRTKAMLRAIRWLRRDLKKLGVDIKVLDEPLKAAQIPLLQKALAGRKGTR